MLLASALAVSVAADAPMPNQSSASASPRPAAAQQAPAFHQQPARMIEGAARSLDLDYGCVTD
jgi:hypothetical protein